MSSLGQLVAGVAHEINNPVNFIYGNLTYLKDYVNHLLELIHTYQCQYPKPTPAIEEVIERIEFDFIKTDLPQLLSSMYVGSSRIKEIVLSLRNFSRFDEAEYKSVNLKEGLDSTLVILQHRLKATERRSEIKILRTYDSIPTIECYAGLLNQVFMNILANAIDAMDEYYDFRNSPTGRAAQPQLDITIQQIDQDWVAVLLRDNGAGMSPETQQHLFDPFFTTKPVGKGTGLGLSISYQIVVDRHRGHLSCRSVPVLEGGGTEFTVKIPMRSVVS
jgi:two-component system, NtrC family, sensor kinase